MAAPSEPEYVPQHLLRFIDVPPESWPTFVAAMPQRCAKIGCNQQLQGRLCTTIRGFTEHYDCVVNDYHVWREAITKKQDNVVQLRPDPPNYQGKQRELIDYLVAHPCERVVCMYDPRQKQRGSDGGRWFFERANARD